MIHAPLPQSGNPVRPPLDEAFVASLLAEFGTRITALNVEAPSLETVFLSLTGRELRDRAAGAREQTHAFGRRGGEHTR